MFDNAPKRFRTCKKMLMFDNAPKRFRTFINARKQFQASKGPVLKIQPFSRFELILTSSLVLSEHKCSHNGLKGF